MKFEINTQTKEEEIIECAKHIVAWLKDKDMVTGNTDINLMALAKGEIRPINITSGELRPGDLY